MGKNQYLAVNGERWDARGEGNERLTADTRTQAEAIEIARGIAQNQHSELRIQGWDAKFRDGGSFDNPFPPKDSHH